MRLLLIVPVVALATFACGGTSTVQTPTPTPADNPQAMVVDTPLTWKADEDLAPVLIQPELTPYVMEGAERVELRIGPYSFIERLAVVVEDTTAPWLVRLNALRLLADRGAIGELPVFATAMHARDERVRIAAVSGMREFMSLRPDAAMQILALGLKDPSTRVQTAALQMLGDRNVTLLRDFYARSQNAEVKAITLDLIRAAEERGAPLIATAGGTLERTTSAGVKLTYKPTQQWSNWDASVGDVTITPAGGKPMLIASGVEVVGNVVPVFFTNEGKTVVYEKNRVIYARDLAGGEERRLGDGIAPRILPFTSDVLYFTEVRNRRSETPNSFGLRYEVMRIPAAGGAAASIGQVGASALNANKGNYSTLRWARIEEQEGTFFLIGEMIDPYKLPSPFGG